MSKKFECKPKCENLKLEGLVFGCDKCIKKTQHYIHLNKRQVKEIINILDNPIFK